MPRAEKAKSRSAPPKSRKFVRKPAAKPPPIATLQQRREGVVTALTSLIKKHWRLAPQLEERPGIEIRWAPVDGRLPHFHLVSVGLFADGAELSLRCVRAKGQVRPPEWAFAALESVKRAVQSGATLTAGTLISLGLKLTASDDALDSQMQALALGPDAQFNPLATKHGPVPVLAVFGLTPDEATFLREWDPAGLLEIAAQADPLLVVDPERQSMLVSPRTRSLIAQRAEREGSSMQTLPAPEATVTRSKTSVVWRINAKTVEALTALLKGRIGHGRPFSVVSPAATVQLVPADLPSLHFEAPGPLVLKLSQPAARALRGTLRSKPGTFTFEPLSGFAIEVTP